MRPVCMAALLLFLALCANGCGSKSNPSPSSGSQQPNTTSGTNPVSSSAATPSNSDVVVMTPRQIFDAAKNGGETEGIIKPNQGKTIAVTGVIESIWDLGVWLKIDPPVDEFTTSYQFSIKLKDNENWSHSANYAPGQTVTLHSNGRDSLDFEWDIANSEVNPAPIIQASEIAKAFATAADKTNQKFNQKYLYLVGEIAKLEDSYIWLKGVDETNLKCVMNSDSIGETMLNVGDKVQFLGEYIGNESEEPLIGPCILVRTKLPVDGVKYASDVGSAK